MTNKNVLKSERIGEEKYNKQGDLMKIIVYNNASDIVIEFQDKYKGVIHTNYQSFSLGKPINPYRPSVFGHGIVGNKYAIRIDGKISKEYNTWSNVLQRCFNKKCKEKHPSYESAACCNEWLFYENFYEWLHSQENFDKWYVEDGSAIDKDILFKGNKFYSPETCCLVTQNVNSLFVKCDVSRGELPIGVVKHGSGYRATCMNPFINKNESLGTYKTAEEAFLKYKIRKEELIKQVAEIEYHNGNITKQCYDAMMNYEVEIDD